MESVMTISLSKKLGEMRKPRGIRNAASRIRFLVARSAKVDMGFVSIDPEVNNYLLSTAIKNRSKIKLNVSRSGNEVKVALHGAKPVQKQAQADKQKPSAKTVSAAPKKDEAKPAKAASPAKATSESAKPAINNAPAANPKPDADKKQEKKAEKESKEGKK